jgi:hypothetical protein
MVAVGDESFAVVFHRKIDRRPRPVQPDADRFRIGMANRNGNRFLSDKRGRSAMTGPFVISNPVNATAFYLS